MNKVEVKEEKIPWHWVLLIAFLVPIVHTFVWTLQTGAWAPNFTWGSSETSLSWPAGSFLIPLLAALLAILLKKKVDTKFLAYIYAATITALTYNHYNHPGCTFTGSMHSRENPLHDPYLPNFWVPPKEVVSKIFMGGQPIDWGAWAPTVLFWWLYPFFVWLFLVSITTILRNAWIVREELPFPYASAALTMAQTMTGPIVNQKIQKRFFSIGTIISFLFFTPFVLANMFPFLPDIYGWTRPPYSTWTPGSLWIGGVYPGLTRTIVGLAYANLNPAVYALLFFAPLDTLFSFWFFWLIIDIILVQIFSAMGYYTGMENDDPWTRGSRITMDEPLKLGAFGMLGVLPGIIIWWLVMNRTYVMSTIRLALGRGTEAERSLEADEPLPYRHVYLLLAAAFIGLCVIYSFVGLDLTDAVSWIIAFGISMAANARIHGYLGLPAQSPFYMQGWFKWRYPSITMETRTQSQVMLGTLSGWWLAYDGVIAPQSESMDVYRFGHIAKARSRNLFTTMLVTTLIAPLVGFATFIWWSNTYGIMKFPFPHESDWCIMGVSDPEQWNAWPASEPWWPHALLGFIVTGLLYLARIRAPWLPLEPAGLVLSTVHWTIWGVGGFQISALGAWLVKFLIIRIGGGKAYTQYGTPVAAGIVAGYVLAVPLMAMMGGVLRFFFPA